MDTIGSWFKDTCQQIRRLNYEIDDCLSIFSHGSITTDHLIAFNEAVAQRDKLTAQVMRYLAEQIKPQTRNQPETVTKPAPASTPNNLVRLTAAWAESTALNRSVCRGFHVATRPSLSFA